MIVDVKRCLVLFDLYGLDALACLYSHRFAVEAARTE